VSTVLVAIHVLAEIKKESDKKIKETVVIEENFEE